MTNLGRRGRPAAVVRRDRIRATTVRGRTVRFKYDPRGVLRPMQRAVPGLTQDDMDYARRVVMHADRIVLPH